MIPLEHLQSPFVDKIMPALIDAMGKFSPAVKRATNPAFRSKYVDLEGVLDAVGPALLECRIALMQQPARDADGAAVLLTRLVHESGQWVGCEYALRPVKQDPQGEGSALTYARRYSAMAICGIAPEDDDGNAASQHPPASRRPTAEQPNRPRAVPDQPADPQTWHAAIAAASDPQQLTDVGARMATADLPGDERTKLRSAYSARMKELQAA